MEPVITLAVVSAVGGLVGLAIWADGRQRAKHAAAWGEAARRAGGTFTPRGGGFWRQQPARIGATLEHGITVHVDHYTVSNGKTSTTYTRMVADAPGAHGLTLKLRREGVLASLGKALGMGDLELGDRDFDDRFVVKASDAALARAWLDRAVRDGLRGIGGWVIDLKDGKVKAEKVGLELEPESLVTAMRAIAALAGGGRSLCDRWRAAAAALGGSLAGPDIFMPGRTRIGFEVEGRLVSVDAVTEPAPGTRLRLELPRKSETTFSLGPGQSLAELAGPPRPPEAEAVWRALQPANVSCDGEAVHVFRPGYDPDVERVRDALALAQALVPASDTAYR